MKMLTFARRNAKEILRDKLNLFFGLGFPLVILLLLTAIQANIPDEAKENVSLFSLNLLTPGVTVFGLSFITLFSATLISKDRTSSLLQRLYTTPLSSLDFILGYALPMLPIAVMQTVVCYLAALCLGLRFTPHILFAVVMTIPVALFYIGLGLLCGSLLTDKQVGGVCGALLTNLSAWLSGIWFDLALVGGAFKKIAELLPFVHAVEMERAALAGNASAVLPHLWLVLGYAAAVGAAAVWAFLRQMKKQ